MKRVKFTLGLVLSLLFAGANVGYAQWNYGTHVIVNASQHYANPTFTTTGNNTAIGYRDYFEKDGSVDNVRTPTSFTGENILTHSSSWEFSMWGIYDVQDDVYAYLNASYKFYQEFTVKLKYKDGKDNIPFLKRTIVTVTDKGEAIVSQDLLLPSTVEKKTDFTYGTGVANYVYKSDVVPFLLKYEVATVIYELWVDEEISDNPGAGNAYPAIPRAVTVFAGEGITTTPASGSTQYVEAYKDFTFEVYGDPGKELDITTGKPDYAIGKGITIDDSDAAEGKWTVKISKVYRPLDINVSYKSATESNEGGEDDDDTGNSAVPTGDIVKAYGGTLSVYAATPGTLTVYSITGQVYEATNISGSYSSSNLPKGYYIIKLNGKAYKVAIN